MSELFFQIPPDPEAIRANTGGSANVSLMLGQRRRRWTDIKPILAQRPVLACLGMHTYPRNVCKCEHIYLTWITQSNSMGSLVYEMTGSC